MIPDQDGRAGAGHVLDSDDLDTPPGLEQETKERLDAFAKLEIEAVVLGRAFDQGFFSTGGGDAQQLAVQARFELETTAHAQAPNGDRGFPGRATARLPALCHHRARYQSAGRCSTNFWFNRLEDGQIRATRLTTRCGQSPAAFDDDADGEHQ